MSSSGPGPGPGPFLVISISVLFRLEYPDQEVMLFSISHPPSRDYFEGLMALTVSLQFISKWFRMKLRMTLKMTLRMKIRMTLWSGVFASFSTEVVDHDS